MKHLRQEPGFYKSVIALMLPLILQNFITNVMSLADTFMVGVLGEIELAAVTVANTPFFIIMLITFGVQGGTSILTAQYYGKGDMKTISRVFGMGLYVGMALTLLFGTIAVLFPETIMRLLTNNEDLIIPGAQYVRCVAFAYFFGSISSIYFAVQRSMENPKIGAFILSGSGLLNIFLNWVLIFGKFGMPAMGISGAALATLISRVLEVIATVIYAKWDKKFKIDFKKLLRPGKLIARDFVKYASPVMLNEGLWSLAHSAYTIIMGHMPNSTAILAAYTIAGNVERLVTVALFAVGSATAVIIGRDIGRGSREQIQSRAIALTFVAGIVGIVSALMLLLVRLFAAEQFIFPFMGLSEDAVGYALMMLTVMTALAPLRAITMTTITGILRGGGDVVFSLITDIVPMYLVCVPLAAIMALVLNGGVLAVYLCMCLDEFVKVCLCIPRVRSGKWINNITREISG